MKTDTTYKSESMTLSEIKERLCAYDVRNPNLIPFFNDEKIQAYKKNKEQGKCHCDNCFYGRTKLAEELLKHINR